MNEEQSRCIIYKYEPKLSHQFIHLSPEKKKKKKVYHLKRRSLLIQLKKLLRLVKTSRFSKRCLHLKSKKVLQYWEYQISVINENP